MLQLPLPQSVETVPVLKQLSSARAALAELKGVVSTIPNKAILINTLSLQEAKDSSEIENIVTTRDELYKSDIGLRIKHSIASKEVQNYQKALMIGFTKVQKEQIISHRTILEIQETLEQNQAGYRKVPGTVLKNDSTNETVYIPPQDASDISRLMDNLIQYINDDTLEDYDPLIKMAIIHHRFESIHPFYDGNGRTGRILNILYLVLKDLQDLPLPYLSRYINQYKSDYYLLLQEVRHTDNWEQWLLYILRGIEVVSTQSISLIKDIKVSMQQSKEYIRSTYSFYSQDLLNHLYKHPYTKIDYLAEELPCNRKTAANYLNTLATDTRELLEKVKVGRSNYYVNTPLVTLIERYDYQLDR